MNINTVNNKNTSPANDTENEAKNKGLMVEDYRNFEELDAIKEILTILEKEEIISSWSFDREDKDKEKIHSHYYFNSDIDNNALNSLIRTYLKTNEIDKKKINKIKEKIIMDKELYNTGVLDTDPKGFKLNKEQEEELRANIDNITLIGQDSDGVPKYDDFISHNRGYGEFDKPTHLIEGTENIKNLRGQYDFTFYFDKDISQLELEKEAEISLSEVLSKRYKNADTSFLNIDVKVDNNTLNMNFNNVLKSSEDNSFFMVSKTQMKKVNELFLKRLAERTNLVIQTKTSHIKYYKTEEEVENKRDNKKLLKEQYLSGHEHLSEAEKAEVEDFDLVQGKQEKAQADTDMYLDFMIEIKNIKTFEEMEVKKAELEAEAEKVEAVKGILPVEIIEEKLEDIANKKELLSIIKVERTAEQALREELEATKKDLAAQTQTSEDLATQLNAEQEAHKNTTVSKDKEIANLKAQLEEQEEEAENMELHLNSIIDNKDNKIAEQNNLIVKKDAQLVEVKQELTKTTETLKGTKQELHTTNNKLVSIEANLVKTTETLTQTTKKVSVLEVENKKTNEILIITQEELEVKTATLETTEAELVETTEALSESERQNQEQAKKLQELEIKLNEVERKLKVKEEENKGLLGKIKTFGENIFNLENSNKALNNKKLELEAEITTVKANSKAYLTQVEAQHLKEKAEAKKYTESLEVQVKTLTTTTAEIKPTGGGDGKNGK